MLDTPSKIKPAYKIKRKVVDVDHNKLNNTNELKERLVHEMIELDKQKQHLEHGSKTGVDFGMIQSYKEMIQSRRVLLDQIKNSLN